MKLINKETIVQWAKDRLKSFDPTEITSGRYELNRLLEFINTLEAKEVDLEKELESWRHNHFHGRRDKEASGEYLERITQLELAKHFFELGLKAQKGE